MGDNSLDYGIPTGTGKPKSWGSMNLGGIPMNSGVENTNAISTDTKVNPLLNFSMGGSSDPEKGYGIGALFKDLGGMEGLSKFASGISGLMTAMNGQDYMHLMRDQYNTQKTGMNIGLENQGRIADTTNGIQGYLRGGAQGLTGDALNAFNDKYVQQHALSNARV
jgi:hypothetical protein